MEERAPPENKRDMMPIEPHAKIFIALMVAVVWFLVTKGKPPRSELLEGISHISTETEEVFETAIAIEKKEFTKRIIQSRKGYWSYIPYINQPRWIDLQITLTTKIGYDLKNGDNVEIGVTTEGRPFIQIYQPTVISKHWTAKIIDKSSDNLFNKWDIEEYKKKQEEILEAISQAQSENILQDFKNDPNKMSQLAHRLDQKLLMRQSLFSSPLKLLSNLNTIFDEAIKKLLFPYQKPQPYDPPKRTSVSPQEPKKTETKGKVPRASRQNKIGYTEQQKRIRQTMKHQLQL